LFCGQYFIEPGTGRQFSSLEAIHRHLAGEVNDRRLTRAGSFFQDKTRVYEGSRTKQVLCSDLKLQKHMVLLGSNT